jgi:phosphonate metabolism-associated iron-containing alcohol dehydrogenase
MSKPSQSIPESEYPFRYQFYNPVRISNGNLFESLKQEVGTLGKVLLVTSPGWERRGLITKLREVLGDALVAVEAGITPNPTLQGILKWSQEVRGVQFDTVLAVGGGSVLDAAKCLASLGSYESIDWFELALKRGIYPTQFAPRPIIAVPTTAGTGSEVTPWATVWDMQAKKKYSLSHPSLFPRRAILDSGLTLSLPDNETMQGGLDALSHSIEAIWNKNHNPISDLYALKAIELLMKHLPLSREVGGDDRHQRNFLMQASLFAGLASSNTRTALAHSISYPLTAHFNLPHGIACSLPLPHLLRFNAQRRPDRLNLLAKPLGCEPTPEAMAGSIESLFIQLGLPTNLLGYGIDEAMKTKVMHETITPGRAENNIAPFDEEDVHAILMQM